MSLQKPASGSGYIVWLLGIGLPERRVERLQRGFDIVARTNDNRQGVFGNFLFVLVGRLNAPLEIEAAINCILYVKLKCGIDPNAGITGSGNNQGSAQFFVLVVDLCGIICGDGNDTRGDQIVFVSIKIIRLTKRAKLDLHCDPHV